MNRVSRQALLGIALFVVAWLVWSKVRIGIFINLSLWQALALFGIAVVVLFLALDHLLNRRR